MEKTNFIESERSTAKRLLHKMHVPSHLIGYKYLCVVIPKFEVGVSLRDLYDEIAIVQRVTWRNIERSIYRAFDQSDAQGRKPLIVIAELKEQFESEREAIQHGNPEPN